ncbi:2-amino-4-hydroxy-6-hydroxymethyldihydropteridine diphosphokinase [Alkalimonas mucilaginosa]|uniref:2-amino-4-hydroxy-6-hydroxymethyldihydropteridine pyrophosphokinase n=1 Tax=Alkalimonas mucilaginosa TaxID=3057676 RepID=A0ABU7JCW1_9GAMM|nr:2-amino-4-hydroxy-6-hydroxymethyldihydropteridine diphosphokinase [Alkalimonas sp. MEB004]MEE2023330.1 2-amino-4-hydroxy-6-hydroxymethyldihydropteridine diphosphokinase [Alkalimonas sp. MEB004]
MNALGKQRCFIGLGANLNNPMGQVRAAISALAGVPDSTLGRVSSLYGSKPMGPQDQPDYVNAVAELYTELSPLQLLDALQQIEQQQGRVRKDERWGPRTLDLDLLLYGNEQWQCERLTVPHYGLAEREFVLYPLQEIAADLQLPDGRSINSLCQQVPHRGLAVVAPAPC